MTEAQLDLERAWLPLFPMFFLQGASVTMIVLC